MSNIYLKRNLFTRTMQKKKLNSRIILNKILNERKNYNSLKNTNNYVLKDTILNTNPFV